MKTNLKLNHQGGDVRDLIGVLMLANRHGKTLAQARFGKPYSVSDSERSELKRKAAHFKRCCEALKGKK